MPLRTRSSVACLFLLLAFASSAFAQGTPSSPIPTGTKSDPAQSPQKGPGEAKAAAADSHPAASGKQERLSAIDPSVPPPRPFARPRIGLALGGGGALGLSEVGVLQWFEENHIPVDEIAGTSMGCMISALYSTGRTPEQLTHLVNARIFTSVFALHESYRSRSFRRREETRELPNQVTIGLKNGVSLRNAVLVDQGLNAFLDREFLRYDDQVDFNSLPIPLRCVSTDLTDVHAVAFARGSLPDAVRASVSLPGIFSPFEMNGHAYVDGGVLENLPTPEIRKMNADVVLAVSLPLPPLGPKDLGSFLSVLTRSFFVAIESAEQQQRKLADVVIMPDISGFTTQDYLRSEDLAQRGYQAAEKMRDQLLKYRVSDAEWQAYLAHRQGLIRGPAGPVLRVRVTAPDHSAQLAVQKLFAPLVNQPVDTARIEALLDQIRADGALDADYTIGYESPEQFARENSGAAPLPSGTVPVPVNTTAPPAAPATGSGDALPTVPRPGAPVQKPSTAPTSNQPGVPHTGKEADSTADRPGAQGLAATADVSAESLAAVGRRPIVLVNVTRRRTGPPFLLVGLNVESQTSAPTHATVEGIILDQDLGGYGSELRGRIKLGYQTELGAEYFRPLNPLGNPARTYFALPHIDLLREPFPIYNSRQVHLADRQFQRFSTGFDLGWTNQRTQQLRAGYDFQHIHWETVIGNDSAPDLLGNAHRARVQYDFDTQDRALVPQYGFHVSTETAFLFSAVGSPNAPSVSGQASWAHRFSLRRYSPDAPPDPNRGHEVFVFASEGGSFFHRSVADPFRFTLGGPLRLSASAIDQYRGTDYWLLEPALLRRIANLPAPLGQSIYIGLGVEAGQVYAPGLPAVRREDAYFGVVAETPLGVITLAPAIGTNGERKLVFTLGHLF